MSSVVLLANAKKRTKSSFEENTKNTTFGK
jgi:hypothetical protein